MAFGFPPFYADRISFDTPVNSVLRESVRETIKGLGFALFEESKDQIVASAGMSVKSWGEKVHVNFLSDNSISVTSKSKFALVDWGKNKNNVERIRAKVVKALL